MSELSKKIEDLYLSQIEVWPAFSQAIQALNQVKSRELTINNDSISVQFNPARIRSTAASIDSKTISERACFLCPANRPKQQQEVLALNGSYSFLVNPFPILDRHFTVVNSKHQPQTLEDNLVSLFELVKELDCSWSILFNGAKAGASAPDHLHFQVLPKQRLPIFNKLDKSISHADELVELFTYSSVPMLLVKSLSIDKLTLKSVDIVSRLQHPDLLNAIAWRDLKYFYCLFIPRKKHRPECYFSEGPLNFLVSPATIELCGIWVFPRSEDFERVGPEQIKQIIEEVCFNHREIMSLASLV